MRLGIDGPSLDDSGLFIEFLKFFRIFLKELSLFCHIFRVFLNCSQKEHPGTGTRIKSPLGSRQTFSSTPLSLFFFSGTACRNRDRHAVYFCAALPENDPNANKKPPGGCVGGLCVCFERVGNVRCEKARPGGFPVRSLKKEMIPELYRFPGAWSRRGALS